MRISKLLLSLAASATVCLATSVVRADDDTLLYQRLGGEKGVARIVEDFTTLILDDDRINFAFAQSDMTIFKQRLTQQFCAITDGPCAYTGRDMRTAHLSLAVTTAQFNALAEDLYTALERSHIPYRVQNQLMALLAPMERDIVRPGVAPATKP